MVRLVSLAALTLVASVHVATQTRPDFNGRWMPSGRTDAPGLVVIQDATSLIAQIADQSGERVRYDFDRTTSQDVAHPNLEVTSTASWKESTLRTTSTFRTKAEGTTLNVREEVWSLDADGRLLIEVTTRRTGGQTGTSRQVYQRSGK